jgi:hypothetical protein
LKGTYLYGPHYDRVVRESATVVKPDGSPLLTYLKDALPQPVCHDAFAFFNALRLGTTDARGLASGSKPFRRQRRDGLMSKTTRRRSMQSQVVGFFDGTPRNPYCRMTSFTRHNVAVLEAIHPMASAVNQLFREHAPERWQAQQRFIQTVDPEFVLRDTVFTTITVNRSERMAVHKDAHDYRPGFGVMAVLEGGRYYGGELIFPKYRTAVDMRTGGVCLADVHEYHGNAPLVGWHFVRFSFVFYAREHMDKCAQCDDREITSRC